MSGSAAPTPAPSSVDARAKAIFDEAIELTGESRKAYLDGACDEPALRSRVEVLLRGAETDDAFLRGAGVTRELTGGEPEGAQIGPYRLVRLIGEGGFGSVYMAEQERPVRRRVALKIIKLGMDTRAVVARFEQERQALAVMDHPNIAKVFDAGATATGRPYFVMELVEGSPITDYCDDRRLTIEQRLNLFVQVCGAVQHAHTKGVIHRDLKPSNILVCPVVESGGEKRAMVKVIDFGIAKAIDRPLTEKTFFTEQRQPIGTPEYMSPEQAEGSGDLDTRTDVYSLGVVLYELLAGLPPFDPQRLRSAAYAEIQRIIREVEPPRPSTRLSQAGGRGAPTLASVAAQRAVEPARLNSLLKGELDWIVMRALEKERGRRYESPGALAGDVARYLRGEVVEAAPPSRVYRVRKFVGRNRVAVVAAALVASALLLGSVGTGVGMLRARAAEGEARQQAILAGRNAETAKTEAERADREAADATRSAKVASSVNRMMRSMIERADRGKEGGRADVTVREVMDAAARELESEVAPGAGQAGGAQDPTVSVALAHTISDTYRELSLYEKAVAMARIAADGERALHGEESVEYASAMNDVGAVLKLQGDLDGARASYKKAHDIAEKLGEPAGDVLATVEVQQGVLAAETGDLDAGEAAFRRVLARGEARGGLKTEAELEALNNIAAVEYQRGKLDVAEATFKRSIELRKKVSGLRSMDLLDTLHNLGALQYAKHDLPAADKTIREEVDMARRVYGEAHIKTAEALNSLSLVLQAERDLPAAEQAKAQAIGLMRARLAPDHLTLGSALRDLGSIQLERDEAEKAEASLREACGILDAKLPAGNLDAVMAHYQLAMLLHRRGAFAEAEAGLRPVIAAADGVVKEGDRYEWILLAAKTMLGEVVADAPGESGSPGAERFAEAEKLIVPSTLRLLEVQGKMGPRMRATVVPDAVARAVRLYERWSAQDPSGGHGKALEEWKGRLAALGAPSAPAQTPPK